jgi:hypothetical protein
LAVEVTSLAAPRGPSIFNRLGLRLPPFADESVGSPMMSALQYREHAEHAAGMAARTLDAETAAAFESVARDWDGLANMAVAHDQLLDDLAGCL